MTGPKREKKWYPVLLAGALATACITVKDLDDRLSTWVGKDTDELVTSWGAPTGTYLRKDGAKVLTYDQMGILTTGPGRFAQTYSRNCRVDFTSTSAGKIASATWHGAADQCDRSIIPFGSETRGGD